jgi:hypothetical protein
MSIKVYTATCITGATGSLDSIDGAALADGDICYVAGEYLNPYKLDDDLGGADLSPDIITPLTNGGSKRWVSCQKRSGTTGNRPSLSATSAGYTYWDTTLGKLIIWNGSAWKYSDGSTP